MRNIKFRVWDTKFKQWVENYSQTHNACIGLNEIFQQKDFIFQEYTGLNDKNGREIYEGDTLKIDDWEYNPIVMWHNGGFITRYSWIEKDIVKHADCGFAYFVGKNIIEII